MQLVGYDADVALSDRVRIEASTPDGLLDQLDGVNENEALVAIDSAVLRNGQVDIDELVATASVLVVRGVRAFETSHTQVIRRVFDMHRSISTGDIEVLSP